MAFYMNMAAFNEDAAEYLEKKQKEYNKRHQDAANKFHRFTDTDLDREAKLDKEKRIKMNPSLAHLKRQKDERDDLKRRYPNVTPDKFVNDPKFDRVKKISDSIDKEHKFANRVALDKFEADVYIDRKNKIGNEEIERDYDAAKKAAGRHYRKETKKGNVLEQGIFAECRFLNEGIFGKLFDKNTNNSYMYQSSDYSSQPKEIEISTNYKIFNGYVTIMTDEENKPDSSVIRTSIQKIKSAAEKECKKLLNEFYNEEKGNISKNDFNRFTKTREVQMWIGEKGSAITVLVYGDTDTYFGDHYINISINFDGDTVSDSDISFNG